MERPKSPRQPLLGSVQADSECVRGTPDDGRRLVLRQAVPVDELHNLALTAGKVREGFEDLGMSRLRFDRRN